jgi:hypothetical protein
MVGPNWDGDVPAGITEVFRSPTELAAFCPRVFLNDTDEDRAAGQPVPNQVMVYSLSQFDGTMKTKDWKAVPTYPVPDGAGAAEIRWVVPEKLFDERAMVLNAIPPLPGEEALYALIGSVLEAAQADPEMKQALTSVAAAAEQELISPLLQWRNGPPAGNSWYSPTNRTGGGPSGVQVMLPEAGIQRGIRSSRAMPRVAASDPSP